MTTGIHPKQIRGTYGPSLFDQLRSLDLDSGELDIEYRYDPDSGAVLEETITDRTTGDLLKTARFTYRPDGGVDTETVTRGENSAVKTYRYDEATGNVIKIEVRRA